MRYTSPVWDHSTVSGINAARDYIHVVDLARGHVNALKAIQDNCGLVTYNLGTGKRKRKAERELGWRAEYGINEMVRDSWNWQKRNPNGFE